MKKLRFGAVLPLLCGMAFAETGARHTVEPFSAVTFCVSSGRT